MILWKGVVFGVLFLPLAAGAVGDVFEVVSIDSLNDGSVPVGCSGAVNNAAGGVFEVSLDLDSDGVEDICLGSGSASCDAGFNFDCVSATGGSQCSIQNNLLGQNNEFMEGDLLLSTRAGQAIGPLFVNATESTDAVMADTDLVFGFQGASNHPGVEGYVGLRVNSSDCSYQFTGAYFDSGDDSLGYGDVPVITVNSIIDDADAQLDGICDTTSVMRGDDPVCTLRAAIQEANNTNGLTAIHFDIPAGACPGGVCVIDVDTINNGFIPDIIKPVIIDGTTQSGNEAVCSSPISNRANYGLVIQGDSNDIGLRLEAGSDGSTIKGLNIRNFFNNIAVIDSSNNKIACNFIGTDETGMMSTGGNAANGVILGCDSKGNVIGGLDSNDGNLISGHAVDGVQFFADFGCPGSQPLMSSNAVLGNYIGTDKTGQSVIVNIFTGVSFFGGPAFNNFIGVLQDGTSINGNVIGGSEAGIYIDDGTNNTLVLGNYIGTDATGTADLGNVFGGVDIVNGSNNVVGGLAMGEPNVIANNNDGVFISGLGSAGNTIRGNSMYNNDLSAIELVIDGMTDPDGQNPNDTDDADAGANLLMNYPEIQGIVFDGNTSINIDVLVDATGANASYPLTIDVYYDANETGGIQGRQLVASYTYFTPQSIQNDTFNLPSMVTGGYLRLTATDDVGNTSEMSPPTEFGEIDLIFKDGFEGAN